MNFTIGAGTSRYRVNKKDYRALYGQVGINYFPLRYFEIGLKAKPTRANNKTIGNHNLFESNVYFRYYPFLIACNKIAVFTGASLLHDGAEYSPKGYPVNKKELLPSLAAGLVIVPTAAFQLEAGADIFLTRTVRYNVGTSFNLKTIRLN